MTIYYLCMDDNTPSGGRRIMYRHVDILNEAGINAAILHNVPGFRLTWFKNDTAVVYGDEVKITPEDYIVVPETRGMGIMQSNHPRIVIFNQNVHYTWAGYQGNETKTPYHRDNLKGVMVVSEHNKELLEYAFPFLTVDRVVVSLDADLFTFSDKKEKIIAYMPRRGSHDLMQVLQVLKWRGALEGWRLVPIQGLSHWETADVLKRAAIFLSSGYQEGCPMPPLEAAASGCQVIGYDGFGGAEYFDSIHGINPNAGDIKHFAEEIELFVKTFNNGHSIGYKHGSDYARDTYSRENERASVLAFWRQFEQPTWNEYQHYWNNVTEGRNVDSVTTHMSQAEYDEYYKPILDKILNGSKPKIIFDVGCGGGMIVNSLKERFGQMRYIGLDINPNMIAAGRERYPQYDWRVLDEFKLPTGGDLLLCHSVFTHIYEDDANDYLDAIHEAIAPHGRASISIHIDHATEDNPFVGNIGRCDYHPPYFENKLKEHGLTVVDYIDGPLPHGPQRYYIVEVSS